MTAGGWLRVAAGLTLFNALGHTFGAVLAGPSEPGEAAIRDAMRGYRAVIMGVERSYWDFYHGSAWALTVLLLALAAIMWLLVPVVRRSPGEARPIIAVLAAGYAALTLISVVFFVTAPMVNGALVTVCLMTAAMKSGVRAGAGQRGS